MTVSHLDLGAQAVHLLLEVVQGLSGRQRRAKGHAAQSGAQPVLESLQALQEGAPMAVTGLQRLTAKFAGGSGQTRRLRSLRASRARRGRRCVSR